MKTPYTQKDGEIYVMAKACGINPMCLCYDGIAFCYFGQTAYIKIDDAMAWLKKEMGDVTDHWAEKPMRLLLDAKSRLSALPNAQDQRDGCLAQAVPSTDCDKQPASLHRIVRLIIFSFLTLSVLPQSASAYQNHPRGVWGAHTFRIINPAHWFLPTLPIASAFRKPDNGAANLNPIRTQTASETSACGSTEISQLGKVRLGLGIWLGSAPLLFVVVATIIWEALRARVLVLRLLASLIFPLSLWLTLGLIIFLWLSQ
jgi:hypothetical protein